MGLRDRIFRRNSPQQGSIPGPPVAGAEASPQIPDATFISSPAVPAEPAADATAILPGAAQSSEFPAPPPQEPPAVPPTAPQEQLTQQPQQPQFPPGPPPRPGFRERGRLRRRLRYLKQIRELGYRDLGGLVFDQHRFERRDEALVDGKVLAIETLDREIRSIEEVLALHTPYSELFIPGVGACARCGTLHGSDAHFCPNCGLAFGGPRSVAGLGVADQSAGQQPIAPATDNAFNNQPDTGPPAY